GWRDLAAVDGCLLYSDRLAGQQLVERCCEVFASGAWLRTANSVLIVDPAAIRQPVLAIEEGDLRHAINAQGGANLVFLVLHHSESQVVFEGKRSDFHDRILGRAKNADELNVFLAVGRIQLSQLREEAFGNGAIGIEKDQRETFMRTE